MQQINNTNSTMYHDSSDDWSQDISSVIASDWSEDISTVVCRSPRSPSSLPSPPNGDNKAYSCRIATRASMIRKRHAEAQKMSLQLRARKERSNKVVVNA